MDEKSKLFGHPLVELPTEGMFVTQGDKPRVFMLEETFDRLVRERASLTTAKGGDK